MSEEGRPRIRPGAAAAIRPWPLKVDAFAAAMLTSDSAGPLPDDTAGTVAVDAFVAAHAPVGVPIAPGLSFWCTSDPRLALPLLAVPDPLVLAFTLAAQGSPGDTLAPALPTRQDAADPNTGRGQLSLWGAPLEAPPPCAFVYDAEVEGREYCRALLPAAEVAAIDAEVKKSGFMTMAQVRDIVRSQTVKETIDARGETLAIDADIMMVIDTRINHPIFVVGDNVYTRDELYAHFPFAELKAEPETVFVQQEIGVFPARKYALDADEFEYLARDAGDETVEFVMLEDLVGRACDRGADGRGAKFRAERAPV